MSRTLRLLALAGLLAACSDERPPPTPSGAQAAPVTTPTAAPTAPPPKAEPAIAEPPGAALYGKYCALCHGEDRRGYVADNAPSLVSRTFLESVSDEFLRAAIVRGRPGTAMAGYGREVGGPLGPAEVDALIAFLRTGEPARINLPEAVPGDPRRGLAVYHAHCVNCHGTPTQRSNAVHLANPVLLETASPAFLRHAIVHGRPGTPMEPWGTRLGPQQVDDVLAFILTLGQRQPEPPPAPAEPAAEPPEPEWGEVVINPKGRAPRFELRDDRFVPMDQVKKALDEKRRLIIVDARATSDWMRLRITGSVSLPYYNLSLIDKLPNDGTWIIAYCGCPHHASGVVVNELRKRGFKNSAVLDEGLFSWQRAGYPVEAAEGAVPVPEPPPHPPH